MHEGGCESLISSVRFGEFSDFWLQDSVVREFLQASTSCGYGSSTPLVREEDFMARSRPVHLGSSHWL